MFHPIPDIWDKLIILQYANHSTSLISGSQNHWTMPKQITRIFDFAYYQLDKYNLSKSLVSKTSGQWVATSSKEFIDKANAASRGLLKLGVNPGDRIALISSTNRTEWNIMDLAILQIGAINVPIYPTIGEEDYKYIFDHSEVKYCLFRTTI